MCSITSLGVRAAGVVLLALALPASAVALTAPVALPTLSASLGSVKHYSTSFSATAFGAELDFTRTAHGVTQVHSLSNNNQMAVTYTAAADLSSATIAAKWGSHGGVSLTFKPSGPARKLLPKGCTGKPALSRTGTLTGLLMAKLDTGFFKTVRRKSIPATLSESGSFSCGVGGGFGGPGLTVLGVTPKTGGLGASFVRAGSGPLTESASVDTSSVSGNWLLRHTLTVTAPHGFLTVASDSSSAQVKGKGPFSGTLRFKAVGAHQPNSAVGTVSGSFKAKFDSIGTKRIARGLSANLSQP